MSAPDALRDALGEVIARERQTWRRDRELIEAQAKATIAELRAEVAALTTALREEVAARLAAVRDGKDGRDGVDGAPGRDGADGKDGAPGRDGIDGRDGERGTDGRDGERGAPGERGIDGAAGRDGVDGRDGERGTDGAPGKLPIVREWEDRVHYAGDVVTFGGALYQAARDTGKDPLNGDWSLLVAAGADGRSMAVRGTWSEAETYRALDVVAADGGGFVARRDDPGPCPGDGWQMIARQGKPGKQGDPGRKGDPGQRGKDAPPFLRSEVLPDGVVRLLCADDSAIEIDLYPLLNQIAQSRAPR